MIVLIFLLITNYAICSNILVISPVPSPSHYLWNKLISLKLVETGHNVTFLAHYSEEKVLQNFSVITMEGVHEELKQQFIVQDFLTESSVIKSNTKFVFFSEQLCEHNVKTNGLKTLLNYPTNFKFDLIIFDITHPPCLHGLIPRFHNPPVIAVTAFGASPQIYYTFGNPLYPSYMPYFFAPFTNRINFVGRLYNFVYLLIDLLYYKYISIPRQDEVSKTVFGKHIPSINDIQKNISLLLLNYDPVFDYPIPLVPNVIPVGGLHAKPPKPLSKDLEMIMNNSKYGVIYFALGTNLISNIFTAKQIDIILKVFANLNQTVLWKYQTEEVQNPPKNVIIKKWFPQNDVLGHSKTVLFITHCGLLGIQEAMYHAVPMVGMPFFLDQDANAAKLSLKQVGVVIHHTDLTFENFYNAITEILENGRYRYNIKVISQLYKNQPQTAMNRALLWIEHVLRYGNTDYLNVPSRNIPLYQLLNFDAITVLCIFIFLIGFIIKFVVFKVTRLVFLKNAKIKIS